jgi:hypothetical protein
MKNYKVLKAASKVSVRKQKVIDSAAVSEVLDDDGNISVHAQAERSHEELQVVKKCFDSDTGAAVDDSVHPYSLSEVKSEIDDCKLAVSKIQEKQAEWVQLEKDLKAL